MSNTRKRAGAKAITALLGMLTRSGGAYSDLCCASGLSQPVISAWIRELRRARMVFIGSWREDTRGIPTIPVFHWGPFPDVPRPPGKPAKVRVAEWRARKAGAQ
jgi:DNA-binding transcriptional ArsR family regulator